MVPVAQRDRNQRTGDIGGDIVGVELPLDLCNNQYFDQCCSPNRRPSRVTEEVGCDPNILEIMGGTQCSYVRTSLPNKPLLPTMYPQYRSQLLLRRSSPLLFLCICTYRQQALHNLACNAEPNGAHNERELQHFAPAGLKDPVEREREQEEGDEVQRFVGLLVRWDRVVGGREAGGGRDEDQGDESACDVLISFYPYARSFASGSIASLVWLRFRWVPVFNGLACGVHPSYVPANGFRMRIFVICVGL